MKSSKDTVEYIMLQNSLRPEENNDYHAHVVNTVIYTEEDLIDEMMSSGAGLTRSDIASVVAALTQATARIISKGGAIRTPLFNTSFSLPGVYNEKDDATSASLKLNAQAGPALRKAAIGVPLKKVATELAGPRVKQVKDLASGEENSILTPGGIVEVNGSLLKVVGEGSCITFRNVKNSAETPVTTPLGTNHPRRLLFVMPALAAGVYRLIIRTKYGSSGNEIRYLRECEFPFDLNVGGNSRSTKR